MTKEILDRLDLLGTKLGVAGAHIMQGTGVLAGSCGRLVEVNGRRTGRRLTMTSPHCPVRW